MTADEPSYEMIMDFMHALESLDKTLNTYKTFTQPSFQLDMLRKTAIVVFNYLEAAKVYNSHMKREVEKYLGEVNNKLGFSHAGELGKELEELIKLISQIEHILGDAFNKLLQMEAAREPKGAADLLSSVRKKINDVGVTIDRSGNLDFTGRIKALHTIYGRVYGV